MVLDAVLAGINHVLNQHEWARERLRPFAGRGVRVVAGTPLGPTASTLNIDAGGFLRRPLATESPDVAVTLDVQSPPDLLVAFAGRGGLHDAMRQVRIEGDAGLAAVLGQVLPHLKWDAEDDLARVVGDVAAHRVVQGARQFLGFLGDLRGRAESAAVSWLVHENPTLVSVPQLQAHRASVRLLRDDIERLAKRVERLERG